MEKKQKLFTATPWRVFGTRTVVDSDNATVESWQNAQRMKDKRFVVEISRYSSKHPILAEKFYLQSADLCISKSNFPFLDRGRPGRPSQLRTCFYTLSWIIDPKANIKLSSSVVMQNDQMTPPRVIVLSCAIAPRSKLFVPPVPLHVSKVAKLIPVIQRSLQPKWSIEFKGSIISLSEDLQTQIASRSHQASRYNVSFDSPPEYLMDANIATGFDKIASFSGRNPGYSHSLEQHWTLNYPFLPCLLLFKLKLFRRLFQ